MRNTSNYDCVVKIMVKKLVTSEYITYVMIIGMQINKKERIYI